KVMAFTRDVADHLETVGQAHLRHLAQRGVRLLRRRRVDARANAALLRRRLEGRHLVARLQWLTRLGNPLVDRWHGWPWPLRLGSRPESLWAFAPSQFGWTHVASTDRLSGCRPTSRHGRTDHAVARTGECAQNEIAPSAEQRGRSLAFERPRCGQT